MILKILLVVGIIALVYFILIKKKPVIQDSGKENKNITPSSDMVECSKCKIYCELDDALLSNGKYYCSKECLKELK